MCKVNYEWPYVSGRMKKIIKITSTISQASYDKGAQLDALADVKVRDYFIYLIYFVL